MSPAYQGFACRQAEARGVGSVRAGAGKPEGLHAREIRSSESALLIAPTLLPGMEQGA